MHMDVESLSADNGAGEFFERYGCIIFLVAALFLGFERIVLFYSLPRMPEYALGVFASLHSFMFGEPPYSLFDILLGFQFPDEGLLFILQPRNLAIGVFQAFHYGLNVLAAAFPFWIATKFASISRRSRVIVSIGCAICCVAAACLAAIFLVALSVPVLRQIQDNTRASTSVNHYSNLEYGFEFDYPEFMQVTEHRTSETGPSGESLQLVNITVESPEPFMILYLQAIEDPLRDEMYPGAYPPDDTTLKLLAIGDLTNLDIVESRENESAIQGASEDLSFRDISGYRAARYSTTLDSTSVGNVYIRGAVLVTERRDVTLMAIGRIDPDVQGSVRPEQVENLWSQFLSSIAVVY